MVWVCIIASPSHRSTTLSLLRVHASRRHLFLSEVCLRTQVISRPTGVCQSPPGKPVEPLASEVKWGLRPCLAGRCKCITTPSTRCVVQTSSASRLSQGRVIYTGQNDRGNCAAGTGGHCVLFCFCSFL